MCYVRLFSLCYVCMFGLCYVRFFEFVLCVEFQIVLCAVFRRWFAASRLAARFARVACFARLFVTLTSIRGAVTTKENTSSGSSNIFCMASGANP